MKVWLSVNFFPVRGYVARWQGHDGIDIKRNVPRKWLRARSVDPTQRTERGDKQALIWASEYGPVTVPDNDGALSMAGIGALYIRQNPGDVEPNTLQTTSYIVDVLGEYFKGQAAGEITIADATEFRNHRLEEGKAPRTVRNELAFLKQLLSFALEWTERTGVTAIRLGRLPKVASSDEPTGIALSPAEIFRLLKARLHRDTDRVHRIIIAGFTTMLRRRVLYGLRWEWVDAKKKRLEIPAEVMKGRKGKRRALSVPVAGWALEAFGTPKLSGYVFASARGGATKDLTRSFTTLATKAKVRRFTLHDLRRSGYTFLGEQGIDKTTRKILMGHTIGGDVSDGYDRDFEKRWRDAVGRFDRLLQEHQQEQPK